MKLGHLGLGLAAMGVVAGCSASVVHVRPLGSGIALAVPRGNPVEADIAEGFQTYGAILERWGRWSDDPLYSVHWCPRGVDTVTFVPYQSDGHWGKAPGAPAPQASPYWMSDDSETWGDITMHHGWWIRLDQSSSSGLWCWVPGVEDTAARVVWREADGLVAWAPEPPMYVDADEDVDSLSWAYELLGALFDRDLPSGLLHGDAAAVASAATWAAHHVKGSVTASRHAAPTAAEVAAARRALTSYVAAHPVVSGTSASAGSGGEHGASTSPKTEPGALAASSDPSATHASPSSTASTSSRTTVTAEDPLPPSMALYEQMTHNPFLAGMGPAPSPYLPFLATAKSSVAHAGESSGSRSSEPTTTSHAKSTSSSSGHSSSHSTSHTK